MPAGDFDEEYLSPEVAELQGPDLDEEVRFGSACRFIVESEAYQHVLREMESAVIRGFKACDVQNATGLVNMRMMQRTIDTMDALFKDAAATGRMAQEELDRRLTALREEFKEHTL